MQYAVITGSNRAPSPEIAGGNYVSSISHAKNVAQISNTIIKLKGEDWYINNILNNESDLRKIRYSLNCYIDTIVIAREERMCNMELKDALYEVCRYLSSHSKIYIYLPSVNFRKDKIGYLELIHSYVDGMENHSNENKQRYAVYFMINYGFIGTIPGTTKFYYDRYYKKEIQQGNVPLSHIDWIKYQIDYYMNLHIESSLDYGIDNSAFEVKEKID